MCHITIYGDFNLTNIMHFVSTVHVQYITKSSY